MNKTLAALGAIAAVLAGVGITLRAGECADLQVVCDSTTVNSKVATIPHSEVLTLRGAEPDGGYPLPKGCRVLSVGKSYSCSAVGSTVTSYDPKAQPVPECACSSGAECNRVGEGPVGMNKAPAWKDGQEIKQGCELLQPKAWSGDGCVRRSCSPDSAEMVSGVGAWMPLGYGCPPECSGPPRKTLEDHLAAQAASVKPLEDPAVTEGEVKIR